MPGNGISQIRGKGVLFPPEPEHRHDTRYLCACSAAETGAFALSRHNKYIRMFFTAIEFASWKGQPHEQVTVGTGCRFQVRYMVKNSTLFQRSSRDPKGLTARRLPESGPRAFCPFASVRARNDRPGLFLFRAKLFYNERKHPWRKRLARRRRRIPLLRFP